LNCDDKSNSCPVSTTYITDTRHQTSSSVNSEHFVSLLPNVRRMAEIEALRVQLHSVAPKPEFLSNFLNSVMDNQVHHHHHPDHQHHPTNEPRFSPEVKKTSSSKSPSLNHALEYISRDRPMVDGSGFIGDKFRSSLSTLQRSSTPGVFCNGCHQLPNSSSQQKLNQGTKKWGKLYSHVSIKSFSRVHFQI
jgi:hypothetical protein